MSLKTPGNRTFLKNWYNWLKNESYPGVIKEKRAVDSPIVSFSHRGRVPVEESRWKKRGMFEVDAVRAKVLESGDISFDGPRGQDHRSSQPSLH